MNRYIAFQHAVDMSGRNHKTAHPAHFSPLDLVAAEAFIPGGNIIFEVEFAGWLA